MSDAEHHEGDPAGRPGPKLTRGQRIYRTLFKYMGPPQVGTPPYPTAEELERYAQEMRPLPPTVSEPPPGYRFTYYTDAHGNPRRMLARGAEERGQEGGSPER